MPPREMTKREVPIHILQAITTFAFVGKLVPAPGTWGSAVAAVAGWGLVKFSGLPALYLAAVLAFIIGLWALEQELRDRPHDDPKEVIIDEVAGMWVALAFPASAFYYFETEMVWPGPLAAFFWFRFFDIFKPGVIGRADKKGGAMGVMMDDIWAGVYAGAFTLLTALVYHLGQDYWPTLWAQITAMLPDMPALPFTGQE
ncbi:phosphatidylglycerophosphatase A [Rhodobacter sp. TJ_12]|uniref:phosphatidylglycerophosphatase A family protein n=1 Tax=Rhodobacter sp. TJ_12 TaxID=2029399 RepID=UPI001CC1BFB4|nr:phosphatidylglycerophosphatase A [Rhodobacter sp. TJ_12]